MQISVQFDSDDLLRRFEQRRNTAQVWLDSEILRSTEPFVPMYQGDLIAAACAARFPAAGLSCITARMRIITTSVWCAWGVRRRS